MTMRIQTTITTLLTTVLMLLVTTAMTLAEPANPAGPVAKWTFEKKSTVQSIGPVRFDGPGPQSPHYPGFDTTNKALILEAPSWLAIADEGTGSRFDFETDLLNFFQKAF